MTYFHAGDHPIVLASGQPVAPLETVPAAAVDPDDRNDQHLIDEGVLVNQHPAPKGQTKETSK